jgi:predicted metal-dependent phosphoesterase TrpH
LGRADLHSHTTYSDGLYSPTELLDAAKKAGLSALSITDHDTLEAYRHLPAAPWGLNIVIGLEISAYHEGGEIHILAYFVNPEQPELVHLLDRLATARILRAERILTRLSAAGVELSAQARADLLSQNRVGRPHIARALVQSGVAHSRADAFRRFLTPGTPGYERRADLPDAGEVLGVIRCAGGVGVWAHPGADVMTDARGLSRLQSFGLAGIEAYHPSHSTGEREALAKFAKRRGLVATGGSDFHGDGREGAKVGDHGVALEVLDQLAGYQGRFQRA